MSSIVRLLCAAVLYVSMAHAAQPFTIATAANSSFYGCLINLIGSLHASNFDRIDTILVYDLGLTSAQKSELARIQKVSVQSVEPIHPDLLTPMRTHPCGKWAPGWYAWKAIVDKQALDGRNAMLYMDAGTTILGNLSPLFAYIHEHGYFLHNGAALPIKSHVTGRMINEFNLTNPERSWILNDTTFGVEAGFVGCTKKMQARLITPFYETAKYHFDVFADDGSAAGGFGSARHDTSILSIIAQLAGLTIHQHHHPAHAITLDIAGKSVPFHITWDRAYVRADTIVYCSRHDLSNINFFKQQIRFKS